MVDFFVTFFLLLIKHYAFNLAVIRFSLRVSPVHAPSHNGLFNHDTSCRKHHPNPKVLKYAGKTPTANTVFLLLPFFY